MTFASTPGTDGTPRDLLAAATPRPWRQELNCPGDIGTEWDEIARDATVVDAALIVAAVNEYEALLAIEASFRASMFLLGGAYLAHAKDSLAALDAIRRKAR